MHRIFVVIFFFFPIFSGYCLSSDMPEEIPFKKTGTWTSHQDTLLIKNYTKFRGDPKCKYFWSKVAANVPGKNSKQCHERYQNHLDPTINKTPLSEKEIALLRESVQKLGTQWTKIAQLYFTNNKGMRRADLQLKNCWQKYRATDLISGATTPLINEDTQEVPYMQNKKRRKISNAKANLGSTALTLGGTHCSLAIPAEAIAIVTDPSFNQLPIQQPLALSLSSNTIVLTKISPFVSPIEYPGTNTDTLLTLDTKEIASPFGINSVQPIFFQANEQQEIQDDMRSISPLSDISLSDEDFEKLINDYYSITDND